MKRQSKPCKWYLHNDINNVWETSCGDLFEIIDGSPKDNKMKFCPYCGNEIEEMVVYEP